MPLLHASQPCTYLSLETHKPHVGTTHSLVSKLYETELLEELHDGL